MLRITGLSRCLEQRNSNLRGMTTTANARLKHVLVLHTAGFLLLASLLPAKAAGCAMGYRELGGVQNMPQVREHVCPLGNDDTSKTLRITFVRLDEALAGNLILDERTPELEQLFGDAKLVKNEIAAELESLYRSFAHKVVVPARNISLDVTVGAPRGGETLDFKSAKLQSVNPHEDETRRFWSISSQEASFDSVSQYNVSMPALDATIFHAARWPEQFKQFYVCQTDVIFCTLIWRYVTQLGELDTIERDTDKSAEGSLTAEEEKEIADRDKSDWSDDTNYVYKTHFSLFRYLGRNGWPTNFLMLSARPAGCGYSFEYSYIAPPLAFDVAILENSSEEFHRH